MHNFQCPHPQTIPQVRLLIFLTSSTLVSLGAKQIPDFQGPGVQLRSNVQDGHFYLFHVFGLFLHNA
jgi:hypothetical protein